MSAEQVATGAGTVCAVILLIALTIAILAIVTAGTVWVLRRLIPEARHLQLPARRSRD